MSQSTLSRTIAQLEQLIGVPLVERSRPTSGLTAAGDALLPGARGTIESLARGIAGARRAQTAAPVVGVLNSLGFEWLPALRRELTARGDVMPEVHQLTLLDGFDPLSDVVDVGIYPLPMVLPAELRSVTLGYRRSWVALPEDHRLADQPDLRLADLRGEPAIAPPAHEVWNSNIALLFRAQNLVLNPGASAVSMFNVLALVAAGHGWTLAAAKSDFHPWEGVVFRPLVDLAPVRVAAVWARRRAGEERVERLVAALRTTAET